MSDPIEEKAPFPKCADAIEFGGSFGRFSRINNKQFVALLNEKTNEEGLVYKIKNKNPSKKNFFGKNSETQKRRYFIGLMEDGKDFSSFNEFFGQ